jgi:ketosteroid isomerase-like protein
MKRLLIISILIAGLAGGYSCSPAEPERAAPNASVSSAAVAPAEDVVAVITELEREWVAAIVKKDVATLERLLASDFSGTSPTAHTFFKHHAISDLTSGHYVVEAMDLDEISVNVYGDAAVSFTSQQEKSSYLGEDTSGHYHFTDVWIKKDGRWQVVASHGSRFDQPHAKP